MHTGAHIRPSGTVSPPYRTRSAMRSCDTVNYHDPSLGNWRSGGTFMVP